MYLSLLNIFFFFLTLVFFRFILKDILYRFLQSKSTLSDFVYLGMSQLLLHYWRTVFLDIGFLVERFLFFFPFICLNISIHCFLASQVSYEWHINNLIEDFLYVSHFFLPTFIFLVFLFQLFDYNVPWCGSWVYPTLSLLNVLDL